MKQPIIVVVGSANMDMVVSCDHFPKAGETVLGGDFGMYPGGKGANQAAACGRLGARVRLLARMGQDVFRDRLIESLRGNGVDTSYVLEDDQAPTGVALITVDAAGENQIIVVSGSNMRLSPEDIRAHRDVFDGAGILLLQLETPIDTIVEAAGLAKSAGARVILNPAPACELPDELLAKVDVLTPNESEAGLLSGIEVSDAATAERAGRALLKRGVGCVVLTLGRRGSLLVTSSSTKHFRGFEVDAVDSTAAGDAFNGALACGLISGDSIEDAIRYANAVAALSVTRMGAQTSMPSRDEVEAFVAASGRPEPVLKHS